MAVGPLEWMAWTTPTAIFFVAIFSVIGYMTFQDVRSPSVARKGFLPIETTRGDRLYIGLIISAFICLLWLGLSDMNLWGAAGVCLVWLALIMRWG